MSHLVWFVQRSDYVNLRFQELSALLKLPETLPASRPEAFLRMDFSDERVAMDLVEKAVLVRAVVEVWAEADSFEALLPLVQESGRLPEHVNTEKSFCFEVFSHGRTLSSGEQLRIMNHFRVVFVGDERADMENPSCVLCVLEFPTASGTRWFFGRQVAPKGRLCRQPEQSRTRLALTHRPVLGPTTMDNDLAFIMTNVAEICDSSRPQLVFDPFCGTAGLLLTAATRGARIFGGELDARVLHGWQCTYAKGGQTRKDVALNFEHYGFARPEIVNCDNSNPRTWRAKAAICDAVLTDTPYGVRAATKRTSEVPGADERLVQYADEPLLVDLLARASEILKIGGVLVFLMHVELIDLFDEAEIAQLENFSKKIFVKNRPADGRRTLYCPETCRLEPLLEMARYERVIPSRHDLKLESAGLQILTAGTGRLLVKMRRI